jgi:hypothetical protein
MSAARLGAISPPGLDLAKLAAAAKELPASAQQFHRLGFSFGRVTEANSAQRG